MYQPQTIAKKQLIEGAPYSVYGANGIIGQYTEFNHEDSELILTCRGASCGNVHYTKPFSWINGNAMVLKPNNKDAINIDFLRLLLNQKHIVYNAISGSAQPQITRTSLLPITIPLPPLPEQRAIVSKLEQLFSELEDGVANLQKARRQLKVYRQAVLKKAFEGELTREWRAQQTNLPTAEELLEQIQAERERYYEQQLAEWKQAVVDWEADGKVGKKPSRPRGAKKLDAFTSEEIKELPASPLIWSWVKLGEVADLVSGITKGGRKLDSSQTILTPYLRVANVQDGYLDLKVIKEIEALPSDIKKYELEYGDILYTEGGDKDKLGRGTIWKNEIPGCIHQNHIYRARLFNNSLNRDFVGYFSQTRVAKNYFFKHAKQTTNLASINLTVLANLPLPIPPTEEQHQIVQEIESRLSVCDQLEQDIEANLKRAERLRQSLLQKAFAGELLTEAELQACRAAPDWEPAERLLARIKGEKNGKANTL